MIKTTLTAAVLAASFGLAAALPAQADHDRRSGPGWNQPQSQSYGPGQSQRSHREQTLSVGQAQIQLMRNGYTHPRYIRTTRRAHEFTAMHRGRPVNVAVHLRTGRISQAHAIPPRATPMPRHQPVTLIGIHRAAALLHSRGYREIGDWKQDGASYLATARDRRGFRVRIHMNAYTGEIININRI
jgi:hypothetical protein